MIMQMLKNTMKGINILLPLLLSFLLVFSSYGEIKDNMPHNKCADKIIIYDAIKDATEQNFTYYKEFNRSWFAVKIFGEEKIHIEQLRINVIYENSTQNSFFYYMLFNKNGTILGRGGWSISSEFYDDFFFHIDFPFLNITRDYINKNIFSGECGWYEYNLSMPAGIYYLVGMHANHYSCKFRIWINATNITSIETAQGNETYLLDEIDFLGRVNIYSFNYSVMWKGSAEIKTNHSFIGGIFLDGNKGITKLRITLPNGKVERVVIIDAKREYIFGNKKYLKPIIWLQGGKWKFEISRIESHDYPNVFLLFGDVKLP